MRIPNPTQLKTNQWNEKYISREFPDFYCMLCKRYNSVESISEKMYLYFNNITEIPVCKTCGGKVKFISFSKGYTEYCCCKCSHNEQTKQKTQKTNLEKYGHVCNLHNENIHKQVIEKWKEKYGVDNPAKNDRIKTKTEQTNQERYGAVSPLLNEKCIEKTKQTNLEKYGNEMFQKTQDFSMNIKTIHKQIEEKSKERYGVEHYTQTQEYKQKSYRTKKKNNTFNSSKIEEQFACYLQENKIEFIRQYKSKEYPFSCDFYFPKLDLYLEINSHWTHGKHPYNPYNEEDKIQLEIWKSKNTLFYKIAINTWTKRDVEKRNTAISKHLNFIEIFTNNVTKVIEEYKKKETV